MINRLFLRDIPNFVVYEPKFIGMTAEFQNFAERAITKFLTYLSDRNINPESNYILTISVCSQTQFKKKKWEEMMQVFGGLCCGVVVDCRKKENATISFIFSKNNSKYSFTFMVETEFERYGR
jgi:hypothetical protein